MYVTNQLDDTVSVINTDTNSVVDTPITVGNSPTGIAYDLRLMKGMYVTNISDDTVSVIQYI